MPDILEPTAGELLDCGLALHRGGKLPEAIAIYHRALEMQPDHAGAMHLLGVAELGMGHAEAGLQWIGRAVAARPADAVFRISMGNALSAMGQIDAAIEEFRKAADWSNLPEAHLSLGTVLQLAGKLPEAVAAYERLLAVREDHAEGHNNLGNTLFGTGKITEAIAHYRRALEIQPGHAAAHNNLGVALRKTGDQDRANEAFAKAVECQPNFAGACNNLGCGLLAKRQFDDAIGYFRRAVSVDPRFAAAWYNLGIALVDRGNYSEAVNAYMEAIKIRPDYSEAFNNLGNALQALRRYPESAKAYGKAIEIRADADAASNLGSVLRTMGQVDPAEAAFRQALAVRPNYHLVHCNLGNVFKDTGRLDEALASYRRAVELKPSDSITHSNLVYAVHYHPDYDGPAILRENLRWNAMHAARLGHDIPPHENDRDPYRRLRVGYIGSDFREHCQSLFTLPLFAHHDHQRFEIFCYPHVPRGDAITERLKLLVDHWRPTTGLTDVQTVDLIRGDRIDILVDLTMHMSNGRQLVTARKAAPVQVAWLAYPGTTGMTAIDYRLTDPYLDPPGDVDLHYCEKSIRLPDSFWCYDPGALSPEPPPLPSPGVPGEGKSDGMPAVNALPALTAGYITFGCLNNFCKVTEPTLQLWMDVLSAVANSRLILLCPPGSHRQRLLDRFANWGIEAGRIEFVEFQPRDGYLRTYHRIDIGVDTVPYNGHTTSLDSYWMGVPVVTLIGRTAVGRAGWSQLNNLGMTELAAMNRADFARIAIGLANDLPRLAGLRAGLREKLIRSPLMDAVRFAAAMESVFRWMWRDWSDKMSGR